MKATQSLLASILVVVGLALSITAHSAGKGGGKPGKGQDTLVDVYLDHDASLGIRGDQWLDVGATLYPANSASGTDVSCARAILTDQAQGSVRMFVPLGNQDDCTDGPNRHLRIRSDYDLDQDGLCVFPYEGRQNSGSFTLYYGCVAAEPDGYEDVMVTMHLNEVLGPGDSTTVDFQIRLLEYDSYTPGVSPNPDPTAAALIGSQERAFNISLDPYTMIAAPLADGTRHFENALGNATICQVVWKNARAKDCVPIVDGSGEPIVITGLTIRGKVDPTPLP